MKHHNDRTFEEALGNVNAYGYEYDYADDKSLRIFFKTERKGAMFIAWWDEGEYHLYELKAIEECLNLEQLAKKVADI